MRRIARPALARRLASALEAGPVLLTAGAGYGKTSALEEAIELAGLSAAWVSCRDAGGEAGRLLLAALRGLRGAVPGLADVLGDRLAAGAEPVDVEAAAEALIAELEGLLVERLVIVLDDAEVLEDPAALALADRLVNVRGAPVSVAIATRRALPLKLARLKASGRLAQLGPADLAFTAGECEELLRLGRGREVSEAEVGDVVAETQGWPMGVALGAGREHLFAYLEEEVLERLGEPARLALVDAAVPAALTPELAAALGLPPGFLDEALFLRRHGQGFVFHPLFRAFLLERFRVVRTEEEQAEIHARVAALVEPAEAIEHWLEAGRFPDALAALATHAQELVRTSPGAVRGWLNRLPDPLRKSPAYLLLDGLLLWGAGQHEEALAPLRAAGEPARALLADALTSVGAFGEVAGLEPNVPAVAWYQVIALAGAGRVDGALALAARLGADPQHRYLEDIAHVAFEPAGGRGRDTLERLHATIAALERDDPHGRLPYSQAMAVLVLRDLGERTAALEWLDRCERESERVGLGFVERDCRLQRAMLLAQAGDLPRAELELARAGPRRGTGWRGVHRPQAEAEVAALRGDAPAAVDAARRALERVAPGVVCYRVWTAVDMARVLARCGAPELARAAIADTLAVLDEGFPGERGRVHRARLLAVQASLDHDVAALARCFEQAGGQADQIVRAHWPQLRPVLWTALAEGAIDVSAVLPALQGAFPGGEALLALIDHPAPAVRRAALSSALAADHPAVLARLGELGKDADREVAAAAAASRERVRAHAPPLRFELLGGFRVRRAGWELAEEAWTRPAAARVVRFLLLQDGIVPEDALFDAFWADRTAETARQHLAVAVSRARRVLDLPGAASSVIEARERTYRLRLEEHDGVDAAEFERAAAGALAEHGRGRRAALERAAALWTGEPLPEDRYANWTLAWRQRLSETYAQVLTALAESYEASGEDHEAIRAAQALLAVDPLNEQAHRRLMAGYARTGRTSHALRQYLECRRALVVELGVEPSAETSALQARILAGAAV